jgi:hypothetical protein
LETEQLFPACILARYLCHFDASMVRFMSLWPKVLFYPLQKARFYLT